MKYALIALSMLMISFTASADEGMKTLASKYKKMTIKDAGKLIPSILGDDKEFMVETIRV